MKAFREEPKQEFIPVHLILETQEEVDKLFALFNHNSITKAMRIRDWHISLQPYHFRQNSDSYYAKITAIIKEVSS